MSKGTQAIQAGRGECASRAEFLPQGTVRKAVGGALAPPLPRVVIGVALDRPSAGALQRGLELARMLGFEPWIVHVLEPDTISRGRADGAVDLSQRQRLQSTKRVIQDWSLFETGIALPTKNLRVCIGDPAEELSRFARQRRADLLIVGGRAAATSPTPGALTRAIIARATCPVLVCGPTRNEALVVATDLRDPAAPVVRTAARFAKGLGHSLSIVHNVTGVSLRGITSPLPAQLAEQVVAERLDQLDRLVRQIAPQSDATLTRERTAVDAVLRVARERDVDLVIIGVRPRLGMTTDAILTEARRSVLTVPLAA